MSLPAVSIVLVNFNTRQMTLDCLQSLRSSLTKLSHQIILVDNASSDGSVEAIRAHYPEVEIIANLRNLGFGAANNLAFARCQADAVLLLNTDTIVHPGAIESMLAVLQAEPTVGAVGCKLENADGSLQRSCWSFPTPLLAWSEALGLHRLGLTRDWHRWHHESEQDVDFVIGAAMLVRRSVIEQVGGFDEDFFLYAEEADWQRRMHDAGWRIRFTPAGSITHLGGASGAVMRDRQLVESCRGVLRYVRKHHGPLGAWIFRLGVITGTGLRLIVGQPLCWLRRQPANKLATLRQTLRWWCGLGPYEGFRELAHAPAQQESR
jgi:GT2 family glycosyltransferase